MSDDREAELQDRVFNEHVSPLVREKQVLESMLQVRGDMIEKLVAENTRLREGIRKSHEEIKRIQFVMPRDAALNILGIRLFLASLLSD